jgi:hypothetical protein
VEPWEDGSQIATSIRSSGARATTHTSAERGSCQRVTALTLAPEVVIEPRKGYSRDFGPKENHVRRSAERKRHERRRKGADDRGEALVTQVARIGPPPAVLCLEVVGEAEEVVVRVAVGRYDLLGLRQAVDLLEWQWRLPRKKRPSPPLGKSRATALPPFG